MTAFQCLNKSMVWSTSEQTCCMISAWINVLHDHCLNKHVFISCVMPGPISLIIYFNHSSNSTEKCHYHHYHGSVTGHAIGTNFSTSHMCRIVWRSLHYNSSESKRISDQFLIEKIKRNGPYGRLLWLRRGHALHPRKTVGCNHSPMP